MAVNGPELIGLNEVEKGVNEAYARCSIARSVYFALGFLRRFLTKY
jgi:hypothetical protein